MSKVKITGIPEVEKKIRETFKKVRESEQMLRDIGEFTSERIKAQARRGKPLNDDKTFPALKKTSVAIRETLAETNSTHPTFKPSRSNLTITGQLIDAIKYYVKKKIVFIDIEDSPRTPYRTRGRLSSKGLKSIRKSIGNLKATSKFVAKTKTTGQDSPPPTNKELDADLRTRGFILYTAFGIESDESVMKRINGIVKSYVRRAIKINFGR